MAIGGPGEGSVAVEEGEDLPSSIDQDGGQSTSGGGREKRARAPPKTFNFNNSRSRGTNI